MLGYSVKNKIQVWVKLKMEEIMQKICIYVIARISQDAHAWTDQVCGALGPRFEIFKPKDHNPWNKFRHEEFSYEVAETDVVAMERSHIGLMLPEYGRDCAAEVGWYGGRNKPIAAFVDSQTEWLRDWMVKRWIDCVVTNNPLTSQRLQKDRILKHKDKQIILVKNIAGLGKVLQTIYRRHYKNGT